VFYSETHDVALFLANLKILNRFEVKYLIGLYIINLKENLSAMFKTLLRLKRQ
jgi:hypothetical protein